MKHRVLVVDDDPDVLDLMERFVSKAGYDVVTAGSAFEAIEVLESAPPEALVLDVMMPGRSGIDVLEHVRWHPDLTELPVICVTAVPHSEEVLAFIQDFSAGLVDKTDWKALIQRLDEVFQ